MVLSECFCLRCTRPVLYILAMSEQDNFSHEDSSMIMSPLHRLHSDLYWIGDYGSLHMSFQRYLREELAISEGAADELVKSKELAELLPDRDFYEEYPLVANDYFRLAAYHFVAPIYETTYTKEDTDIWMKELMSVLLPQDSPHDRDGCMSAGEAGDTWCDIGDCPVRTIAMDVELMCLQANFDALGYRVDADREFNNVFRRVESARAFQILDATAATYLQSQYLLEYTQHFKSK